MSDLKPCPTCNGLTTHSERIGWRRAPLTVQDCLEVPEVRALVERYIKLAVTVWCEFDVGREDVVDLDLPDDDGWVERRCFKKDHDTVAPFLAAMEGGR